MTSGKFLEALGSRIGKGSVFYLSVSVSNIVKNLSNINPCIENSTTGIAIFLGQAVIMDIAIKNWNVYVKMGGQEHCVINVNIN